MAFKEVTLKQARELVKSGRVDAKQIAGLESWSEDSRITVPLLAESSQPSINQEEGTAAPTDSAS